MCIRDRSPSLQQKNNNIVTTTITLGNNDLHHNNHYNNNTTETTNGGATLTANRWKSFDLSTPSTTVGGSNNDLPSPGNLSSSGCGGGSMSSEFGTSSGSDSDLPSDRYEILSYTLLITLFYIITLTDCYIII